MPHSPRRSAGSRSPLATEVSLEIQPSPRLIAAVALWGIGLVIAICAARALPIAGRLPLAALAIVLILPPWLRTICGRGQRAVRRVIWERDGTWTITLAGGVTERGCWLGPASAAAGPFVWLALQGRNRHRLVLDRRVQEGAGFAALRRRLQAAGPDP